MLLLKNKRRSDIDLEVKKGTIDNKGKFERKAKG
jgi:hypothetical protein